jgi:tetratricopeptide (TPR) repeat protein
LRGGYESLEPEMRQLAQESPVWESGLAHLLTVIGRTDEARAAFERLVAADFGGPIDDMAALPMVSRAAEICTMLGDRERAAAIYERLLPHADRWLVFAGGLCTGTVQVRLGTLAATMGDHARAAEHLEAAAIAHREAGAAPITALAEAELAESLRALGQHGRAEELAGHALRTARALGMQPLIERIEAGPRPAEDTPGVDAQLVQEGETWLIDFGGQQARLRHRRGIAHLARLLERPHVEIPALELAGGEARAAEGDAGPMLDDEAKRAYRHRVDELREEIDEARRWNDPERAERAGAELESLTAELSRAVGLGGRDRRAASNAERARVSVTRAIRSAIEAIAEQHGGLGRHLTASVRTGTHCRYAPVAGDEVAWRVVS